jgi:flagellar hook-associated protein 3 FlgL
MKALRDQLYSLGNTRDDSGNYIFSGTRVNTPPFAQDATGKVIYQGDQTQTRVPAGVERTVAFTRSGTDIFQRVVRQESGEAVAVSFFDSMDQITSAVASGDTKGIQLGISEVDDMHFQISLSTAQSGSDQAVVQSQLDVIEETALRLKSTLSDIEDLNYAEAVTRMNKEQLALEAAMGSFAKISGLSLFDYIRG